MTYCRKCLTKISSEKADNFNGYCEKCYHNVESNPNITTINDNIISENEDKKQNIKKNLIIFGSIIGLFLLMFLPFLFKPIYISVIETEYIKSVKNILNAQYPKYEDIVFNGDYNENVSIYMHSDFNNLNYQEKEKIILDITFSIRNEFLGYYDKISKIEKYLKINSSHNKIVLYCEDDYYESDYDNQNIKRNNEIYDLKIALKEQIYSKIQDENYKQYLDNITEIDSLKNILSIESVDECKKEILYISAIKLYEDGYFVNSVNQLNKIEGDYKEKNTYLKNGEILRRIQGTFRASYIELIVIDKWNITFGIDPKHNTDNFFNEYSFKYKIENDEIVLTKKLTIQEIGSGIYERYTVDVNNKTISGSQYSTYYYESSTTSFPEKLKAPKIGMTKSEVENSTWGKPTKINKTTTAYGISEQWVYSNYRYIYFDDGIVTAIQD